MSYKPPITIFDYAQKAGLSVEHSDVLSPKIGGWLDPNDVPLYICVNRHLPRDEQVFIVARELGFYAQDHQFNSLLLDKPWKWEILNSAPETIRENISRMDAEFRAFWLVLWFATGDEFRAFVRRRPGTVLRILFYDNLVTFQLYRLRVKSWVQSFTRLLAPA